MTKPARRWLLLGVLQNIKNTVSVSGYSDETQFENGAFTSVGSSL